MVGRIWPRRKLDSKRRWIARFRIGKFLPWIVVENYSLKDRLTPAKFYVNRDGIVRG